MIARFFFSVVLLTVALCGLAMAELPKPGPPVPLNWYGDPKAPNVSGVWVRDDAATRAASPSKSNEGWLPWPPPLKPEFEKAWNKSVADAAAGKRIDDPVRWCLPPGMPRYVTGMNGPLLIMQTPGRVIMHRDAIPVRRIWMDGRPMPSSKELESFYNGNSMGRYEGQALVTEVAGIKEQPIDASGVPHSEDLKVVERFQRIDAKTLKVEVTLTDETAYTQPMKSTVIYKALADPLWEPKEYLCMPETGYFPERYVK